MTTAVTITLVILLALVLASFGAGYYMFRFAVARRPQHKDYWDPDIPLWDTNESLTREDYETMNRNAGWIKRYPYETVYTTSADGLKLGGRLFEPEKTPCRGQYILCHGYRSHSIYDFSCVVKLLLDEGFSCLLIDHRAGGLSEGNYIGFGVLESRDLVKWCEYLKERFPERPVILDGVSMGSSTIMMGCGIGYPDNVRALVCDCGYTTPAAICKRTLKRWFKLPPFPIYYTANLFVKLFAGYSLDEVSSADCLKKNRLPLLMAHGKKDGFVPYEMSLENFKSCGSGAVLFTSEEADHGLAFLRDHDGYMNEIRALWERAGI